MCSQSLISALTSTRLELIPLSPEFLQACLMGELTLATSLLGHTIPAEWLAEQELMRLRLDQLHQNPALQPWLLRAIILRESQTMIGNIGFHSAPGPEYLAEIAPSGTGVEVGYTIFPAFRRQAYAREACATLMAWAANQHHVDQFVLTISPDNLPSLRIAQRLGFRKVGTHIDDVDGPEDIFLLDWND
jgi:RimJ/RimL family protein N-acetyltransferase